MKETNFDTNRIVKITFISEELSERFSYVESTPIKEWFGLVDTGRKTPEGFVDRLSWGEKIYSADKLDKLGYKVYMKLDKLSSQVFAKAKVIVYLEHDQDVVRQFGNNELAKIWVDHLVSQCNHTFETVVYE